MPPTPLACARVVAIPIAFNEEDRIGLVLDRFRGLEHVQADVAVVDDGSTDGTAAVVRSRGVQLVTRPARGGAGAAIRTAYAWALAHEYDICVILSGNDKDRPSEIGRLIDPIVNGEADLVQGSRYLPGGGHENIPFHRRAATQFLHPLIFSHVAGQRMTDTTNGYRALRLSVLSDERIGLNQPWLDAYDLEPYLLLRAIQLGYAVREVSVTKAYPPRGERYTQMRHLVDWWSILRPVVMLGLGLRT